jgi:nucleolar protein 15
MRAYFSQFGTVEHVRLSRSKKTGASKHYAFLQFASADVAKIAAETMNNYLMFGHILKCRVIPPQQVHPKLWVGADRRFKAVPWNKIHGRKLAEPKGRSDWQDRIDAEAKRRATKAKKLKALGYEFEAPALKDASSVPARSKAVTEQATVVTTADHSQVIEAEATEVAPSPALLEAEAEASTAQAALDEAIAAKTKKAMKRAAKIKA